MKNRMIRILCIALMAALMMGMAGCAQAEPDYYQIGLEVADVMSEIADSEAYLSMVGNVESMKSAREMVNTHDYDAPVLVYSINMGDTKEYIRKIVAQEDGTGDVWENLPEKLQEQLLNKVNMTSICNSVNARMGVECVSFASASVASIKNSDLTEDEPVCYLYIFEKGTPILVSFGYHSAAGMFMFIPEESRDNPEAISALMPDLGVKLEKIER